MSNRQQGRSISVGHSYCGMANTQAGTDPHVAALVYLVASAPDTGKSPSSHRAKMSGATRAINAMPDGFLFLDPVYFHEDFAADLPTAWVPNSVDCETYNVARNRRII